MNNLCEVCDVMATTLVTLTADMDVLDAVALLRDHDIPGAPVVDAIGNLKGFLAEKDCLESVLQAVYLQERGGRVEHYMVTDVETVEADASIADVARQFIDSGHRGMPVLKDSLLVGVLNRSDILRGLLRFT